MLPAGKNVNVLDVARGRDRSGATKFHARRGSVAGSAEEGRMRPMLEARNRRQREQDG